MQSIGETHRSQRNRVYSLDKRDRQSLFLRTQISSGPASFAAHVSLSSNLQLSNNRPVTPVKTVPSSPRLKAQNHKSASQPIKETHEREPPSPAAPPPSFSEWAYNPTPF